MHDDANDGCPDFRVGCLLSLVWCQLSLLLEFVSKPCLLFQSKKTLAADSRIHCVATQLYAHDVCHAFHVETSRAWQAATPYVVRAQQQHVTVVCSDWLVRHGAAHALAARCVSSWSLGLEARTSHIGPPACRRASCQRRAVVISGTVTLWCGCVCLQLFRTRPTSINCNVCQPGATSRGTTFVSH